MADALGQKAGIAYKSGDFVRAQELYAKASQLRPDEPKFSSNSSAAEYEAGRYLDCIKSVAQAWKKIDAKCVVDDLAVWEPFRLKLATRFFKANLHLQASTKDHISHLQELGQVLDEDAKVFRAIEDYASHQEASSSDPKIKELLATWKELVRTRTSDSAIAQVPEQEAAEIRFRALPICKWPSDPILELYSFGHDHVLSLVEDLEQNTDFPPLHLSKLTDEERDGCLSFLFGGSGDGRHVLGTLIDLSEKLAQDIQQKRKIPKIHMTLFDIHPVSLARVLMVLDLLRQLSESRDTPDRLELEAALSFLYVSIVVPDYSHGLIMTVARELATKLSQNPVNAFPQWLHVHHSSIPAIIKVLDYWSNPLGKSTQKFIELHPGLDTVRDPRDPMLKFEQTLDAEPLFYKHLKIISPPEQFLSRHPALERLASAEQPTSTLLKAAKAEVWNTWKPNPTLFDRESTEHPDLNHPGGYPRIDTPARDVASALQMFCMMKGQMPEFSHGMVWISFISEFFRLATKALEDLGDNLMIEVVHADVISGVSRLVRGELGERPSHFPKEFLRAWLSNVPDYTHGFFNTVLYLLPHHPPRTSQALSPLVMSNCLYNTMLFKSIDEFCYTYTLLERQEFEQFLGCRLMFSPTPSSKQEEIWSHHILVPKPLPRPLFELPPKARLYQWLAHVLLCTLANGTPRPPSLRVDLPNNLLPFFRLLTHLREVGFPPHWLGEVVQNIVADTLVTDMKPYDGLLPIPPSAGKQTTGVPRVPRKVHLKAWQMELEAILATIGHALPFHIALQQTFPSFGDIRTYRAPVEEIKPQFHPRYPHYGPISSPFVRVVGLVFWKPNPSFNADDVAKGISRLIEGDPTLVDVQIVLGATKVDLREGIVEWRASETWFEKMKNENWKLAAYRTDLRIAVSQPTSAEKWVDIEEKSK